MRNRARRLLEMLDFYGHTLARIGSYDRDELAQTAVMLVCAILGCRKAAVVLRRADGGPELVAVKGIPARPSEDAVSPLLATLWARAETPLEIDVERLDPIARASALELDMGACFLVAPLHGAKDYQQERIGLLIAADPRDADTPVELDLLGLDVVASVVEAGVMSSEANRELRRLNEQLESRIEARTAALAATNREIEAFSFSVSHDLRAPLRAIDGFSQALVEDYSERLDDQGRDWLRRVRVAAQRMDRLIDDMLRLSRVTRVELALDEVDLGALAGEVMEALRATQPERQVEFSSRPLGPVKADPLLLRIALENLLGNAWKFTEGRSPARIEMGVLEGEGERIYFIRDNGVGFDMRFVGELFLPFHRLHRDSEFEGTGVGLSIVQRIVRRHGGRVWAEGATGSGATFYFTLPGSETEWRH